MELRLRARPPTITRAGDIRPAIKAARSIDLAIWAPIVVVVVVLLAENERGDEEGDNHASLAPLRSRGMA